MPRLRGQSQAEMKIWMKHGLKNQSIRTEDDDVMEAAIGLGKEGKFF